VRLIAPDELLIGAILQEIDDLKINISKLNSRILALEKKYRELNEFIRDASK
jgi:hypothetical protein